MKIKPLILVVLCFVAIGCAAQKTLKEQDVEYYSKMQKVSEDFFPAFNPIATVVERYLKNRDEASRKDLEVVAEKLRQQLIAIQKRVNSIKPTKGQEGNHKYILDRMKDMEHFADDLVRLAEGNDDKLYQSKDDLKKGYTDTLLEIFKNIKDFKE